MKRKHKTPVTSHKSGAAAGSALILTVVLTTLLAIIGVVFLLVARIDKIAASAASENRELNFAIDAIIAEISQQLVLDVPRVPGQEYYDYPDVNNAWLASLEPYKYDINDYRWQQISDVTGYINRKWGPAAQSNVNADPDPPLGRPTQDVIREYPTILLDVRGELIQQLADADGDGIADSKWVQLDDIASTKGKPIYAAIRIIDNDGMLNVNTAYQFNPNATDSNLIDGSSQMQINLAGLARGSDNVDQIHTARCGSGSQTWRDFQNNVIWRIESPVGGYLPFDISDELELRYRYCIDSKFKSRIEVTMPDTTDAYGDPGGLYDASSGWGLEDWQHRITEPNYSSKSDRRHLLNTYNIDRIIDPNCSKMVNVNIADVNSLYNAIRKVLPDTLAAQVAVNLFDFRDNDDYVTSLAGAGGQIYYGFERPCIYISEIAYNFVQSKGQGDPNHISYAIELYKPYSEDDVPRPPRRGAWRLVVGGSAIDIGSPPSPWLSGKSFYVVQKQDSSAPITPDSNAVTKDYPSLVFAANTNIALQRKVIEPNTYIMVDSIQVPAGLVASGIHSLQRDGVRTSDIKNKHKCIRRLWSSDPNTPPTLGGANSYVDNSRPDTIQAHPYLDPSIYQNKGFKNIGEIGMVLCKSAYSGCPNPVGPTDTEATAVVNLADPKFQRLFNYLTVFDPAQQGQDPNEIRIKGRVNINTAPWLVIAQLPWMQPLIAQAAVGYRDAVAKGFESIGELMNVAEMGYYSYDSIDLGGFPDLTPNDGDSAQRNFEERDIIFHRISNLITVRSDVFTAYILVRIGVDGPQKRVLAILDRSQVTPLTGKVKVIALQPVPDPR